MQSQILTNDTHKGVRAKILSKIDQQNIDFHLKVHSQLGYHNKNHDTHLFYDLSAKTTT